MSKFFINRPIVAMVISIVLVLVGALTILTLPIAQFPNITPPEIQILATYVGAHAQTLEQAVAAPIEQQMNAAAGVRKLMAQMKERFPEDLDFVVALDTTRSVTQRIKEIIVTLLIALALVILVVYVFLQGWRATLIPLLAVPVSLVGTFVLFPLFGFSINTLSLFGLVLAIGLVVDDAIVVVEGVERHIEEGMTPKNAALKAMQELSGPVIGIALVLSAVFVPTAFIPGITGRLYQQFAVTIAISVLLSAFNALTLSPALAALLLRPKKPSRGLTRFRCITGRACSGAWRLRWGFPNS
jgi:HAE1 family hydrophobic/amphiphilic exporter-1